MKKFLLSLAAVLTLGCVNAETITETLTASSFGISGTNYKEVSYTSETTGIVYSGQMAGDKSSIQLRSNNSNSGVVVTKNEKGYTLASITVEWNSATANARVLNVYGSNVAYTAPTELYGTIVGSQLGSIARSNQTELTIDGDYEYFGVRSSSGAMYITSITLTWNVPVENGKAAAELSFAEGEVTKLMSDGTYTQTVTNPNNLAVTYSSSDAEIATVDATTGTVTFVKYGTVTITAESAETETHNAGKASYKLTIAPVVKSIAELTALATKTVAKIDFPMTVAFKNYSNIFVTDGTDFIQIYDKSAPDYVVGDVIPAGWTGTYELYNDVTPEITNPEGIQAATENVGFTPEKMTEEVTVADVNKVVMIPGVVFSAATPATKTNFTGTRNGIELSFRNNYTLASVEEGTYNVTVVVNIYNEEPSLYVISYDYLGTTGIEDVVVDENAPVEYFNLQGVRVANPENGLYIRRQGNKVTKVVL